PLQRGAGGRLGGGGERTGRDHPSVILPLEACQALGQDGRRRGILAAAANGGLHVGGLSDDGDGAIQEGDDRGAVAGGEDRSEEHTSELQSLTNLVCRLLLE